MKVSVETGDEVVIAAVGGEIDVATSPGLRQRLIEAVENHTECLVIDLSETRYLDSSGIQVLFDVAARLHSRQQTMHLVIAPDSFLSDLAGAVDLGSVATIHREREAAIEACKGG